MNYHDQVEELLWEDYEIPKIYTPINNFEALKKLRMVALVWYLDELTGEYIVIGQANIKFDQFFYHSYYTLLAHDLDITLGNKVVGQIEFKMNYRITDSVWE